MASFMVYLACIAGGMAMCWVTWWVAGALYALRIHGRIWHRSLWCDIVVHDKLGHPYRSYLVGPIEAFVPRLGFLIMALLLPYAARAETRVADNEEKDYTW